MATHKSMENAGKINRDGVRTMGNKTIIATTKPDRELSVMGENTADLGN